MKTCHFSRLGSRPPTFSTMAGGACRAFPGRASQYQVTWGEHLEPGEASSAAAGRVIMSATVWSLPEMPVHPQLQPKFEQPTVVSGIEQDEVRPCWRERGIRLAFVEPTIRQLDIAGTDVVAHDHAGDVAREILVGHGGTDPSGCPMTRPSSTS